MQRFHWLVQNVLVALLLLAAAASNTAAQSGGREQLNQFASGLESMRAQFRQRVVGNDGSVQDESRGEVWLLRPQQFRWSYGGEFPELVVADGERIWIYDEVLEQVTVKSQDSIEQNPLMLVLSEPARLNELFQVREAGDMDELVLLELRPNNSESEFDRLLLGLNNGELRMLAVEDAFGLRTEMRFEAIERNPPLDSRLFEFVPPDGVDVIGDTGLNLPDSERW